MRNTFAKTFHEAAQNDSRLCVVVADISPAGAMDQESRYLAALQTVATYRVEGTRLEMRTAAGALAAEFQRT